MIELKPLQNQVKSLVGDLRGQVAADDYADLRASLEVEHEAAKEARRTAGTFETWLEDVLDQAAVAWLLGCVFVRFCEDNELIPRIWIGGPTEKAPADRAVQERQGYLVAHPLHNDRHWLRKAFTYMASLGPTAKIFDGHNSVWRFDISGPVAEELSDFFRRGAGYVSLRSETLDTRFLGDLYQNLSAHARETYALLQTPEFVEEFILERTFEPAYKEFGLAGTTVIDPTCGSGHFLLGAFNRLITRWKEREPNTEANVLVQRALDQVTGVDINPFAVAIARFRLMIAALKACDQKDLEAARAFNLRLAVGDSLREYGEKSRDQGDILDMIKGGTGFAYATEDADLVAAFVKPGQYTVVVGNPPYITVKDSAQNATYRDIYKDVCHRQYQLTVPFAQRFFQLARHGDEFGQEAGWVGQITANAFMKREFGTKLINDFFASEVELREVIDTSGAYIPGHGTPTLILVGRANSQKRSEVVRAALGVRGEPGQPEDPTKGIVWSAIVAQIDIVGSNSDWLTVYDLPRSSFAAHPWSLAGGGSSDLLQKITSERQKLGDIGPDIGYTGQTNADAAMLASRAAMTRFGVEDDVRRQVVIGEAVRDYVISDSDQAIFMYDDKGLLPITSKPGTELRLWPTRAILWDRQTFAKVSYRREGRTWWEWHQVALKRLKTALSITFAFVATHNHFVLDRGGRVFNRSAPVIKLSDEATEDDHLRLLGVLNSSTACFWLKQVSHNKGSQGVNEGFKSQEWERFYEFTGTKLQDFPLPTAYPLGLATELDGSADRLAALSPAAVANDATPTRERLTQARDGWLATRARMIALQEELDWEVYRLYGLTDESLTVEEPPEIKLGERAFEIELARKMANGEIETQWFARHGSTPITELPVGWPAEYRAIVEKRIAVIGSDRNVALIERPECKRRWSTPGWEAMRQEALRGWLLDRLEAPGLWAGAPNPMSVAQIADRMRHDDDFRSVLDLWVSSDQHDLTKTLGKLVADEHVPYLPLQRYKPAGLRKRMQWERTWALQRREDAGETVRIDVPPKYGSGDFVKASYWRNRGKLDVPKERFVSYPNVGRDGDPTLLLGWAGWDHLAQAQAIAGAYLERKNVAGWERERRDGLLPLLAGLVELEPWLTQWFGEQRPGFNGSPAQFFTGFIDGELAALGADRSDLDQLRFGFVM
ncbi:BREX-2 system adenine-specific DNA-methyltransferase PglX [Actinoplanes sp. NPDC089786]|uniref:BREX-2 system adenine-specific DNA-methyltransferase PglX n=1 Tax=Actinoplanes sp. NPDC089786 TaxID=3155185 RepID=UPI0034225300